MRSRPFRWQSLFLKYFEVSMLGPLSIKWRAIELLSGLPLPTASSSEYALCCGLLNSAQSAQYICIHKYIQIDKHKRIWHESEFYPGALETSIIWLSKLSSG